MSSWLYFPCTPTEVNFQLANRGSNSRELCANTGRITAFFHTAKCRQDEKHNGGKNQRRACKQCFPSFFLGSSCPYCREKRRGSEP